VTPIGSAPDQIEYRLGEGARLRRPRRAPGRLPRQRRRAGTALDRAGTARGRADAGRGAGGEPVRRGPALMTGLHPHTGERLVEHKVAVPADAKVALAPLVRAVHAAAIDRGVPVATVLGDNRRPPPRSDGPSARSPPAATVRRSRARGGRRVGRRDVRHRGGQPDRAAHRDRVGRHRHLAAGAPAGGGRQPRLRRESTPPGCGPTGSSGQRPKPAVPLRATWSPWTSACATRPPWWTGSTTCPRT
jgi:hypothetical protein